MLDITPKPTFLPAGTRATAEIPTQAGVRQGRMAELVGLAAIFCQVGLVALIVRGANIDSNAFHRLFGLVAVGFVVHHLLPLRFRLPFFTILSLGIAAVLLSGIVGGRIVNPALGLARTGTLLAGGVILIGLCQLRIGFGKRVVLLLAAGLVAVAFRAGLWDSGALAVVWPVLAAMFMFRVMVFLYDVSTASVRPTLSQSLAYFFLVPNVCTLLFPVIDFRTFCTKYYDEEALAIYQRGAKWMARGVLQILLYRLVDRLWAIEAAQVADGSDLIQFVLANAFRYLKVSGGFHLVVGMLLLFGFNLPETNHRYFLAASFTDYWRRVNTYWRVFIMKVFYYPAFFRFKRLGQTPALVVATVWSFVVTWAFHVYQTWWLKGSVTWAWSDVLFWTALAVLVLVNSLWELKSSRQRKLVTGTYSGRQAFALAARTAGTFGVITVLWSLWSTPTVGEWLRIWRLADWHTLGWGAVALAGVMVATILFEVLPAWRRRPAAASSAGGFAGPAGFRRDALVCTVSLVAMFLLTDERVQARLESAGLAGAPEPRAVLSVLRDGQSHGLGRGYYENLTAGDAGTSQYSETMDGRYGHLFEAPVREVNDPRFCELRPNFHAEKDGVRVDTNRWGMRDHDYELAKPPGTFRMALLGTSHVMGYGLATKDMFEPAVEERLNLEHARDGRFELMNFAVNGLSPLSQVWLVQNRLAPFRPDLVLFVAHSVDFDWVNRDVARSVHESIALPAGFPVATTLQPAGVDRRTSEALAVARLQPYEPAMLAFCYRQIVRDCQAIGALPVCVYLPVRTHLATDRENAANLRRIAAAEGFVVIDLSDIYDGYDEKDLVAPLYGNHSSARANALIAAALYEHLTSDPRIDLFNRARRAPGIAAAGTVARTTLPLPNPP